MFTQAAFGGGLGSQPYSSPAIASTALKIQPRDGLVLTRKAIFWPGKSDGTAVEGKKTGQLVKMNGSPPEKDSATPPW